MQQPQWRLRRLDESELDALYTGHIELDFPRDERPSLPAMHLHLQKGLQVIWMMTDGMEDVAYAACAAANDAVMVTLLAVFSEKRGGGKGTALLSLLKAQYEDRPAILLEVEDPQDSQDAADQSIRKRRIAFYEQNGYRLLEGIEHCSFGVRLLLMALPLANDIDAVRKTIIQDVCASYDRILPPNKRHNVTTIEKG